MNEREDFIKRMNIKAAQLDMKNTNFINPTGLEEDNAVQLSSAFDVALMSRYAIKKWPKLIEITSNPQIYIPKTDRHQDYDLNSGINLLTTYPGVVGFKTGFTPSAGLTLVTVARRGGKEVLGVLLGSTDRRDDARAMLDYSFKKLGVKLN
ncbi:MAG: Serine-type D-Ala-D-Ala carboxypeptidase [Candidatus Daviesbacteria bacterium GW2011_GWA1_38_7]|nr:MAG: Serine-type D-Ala-D-Ala carboxypeptidase [Candidatus Daviesbacteria bacterium GW2011_GWA1_38_7]